MMYHDEVADIFANQLGGIVMMYHDEVASLRGTMKAAFNGAYAYVTRRDLRLYDAGMTSTYVNVLGPTDAWLRGALVLRYGP